MGGETSKELVKYLKSDMGRGELDELVQRFCEMNQYDKFKFPIVCFYETRRTDFVKVMGDLPNEFAKHLDSDNTGIVSLHFMRISLALTLSSLSRGIRLASMV
jgi:hypothetical protein